MRYLFDTCAFIDVIIDEDYLDADIKMIFEDWENECYISQETVKELIIKYKAGKLWKKSYKTAKELIDAIYDKDFPFTVLPLAEEHFRTYAKLLPNEVEDHKDPSDHLIISHAITNRIPLISRDRKFRFYENQGLELIYYGRK